MVLCFFLIGYTFTWFKSKKIIREKTLSLFSIATKFLFLETAGAPGSWLSLHSILCICT